MFSCGVFPSRQNLLCFFFYFNLIHFLRRSYIFFPSMFSLLSNIFSFAIKLFLLCFPTERFIFLLNIIVSILSFFLFFTLFLFSFLLSLMHSNLFFYFLSHKTPCHEPFHLTLFVLFLFYHFFYWTIFIFIFVILQDFHIEPFSLMSQCRVAFLDDASVLIYF